MKQPNIENFGFVILCPERNFGGLKATVRSIQYHFPDKPYLCVVGDNATPGEVKEFGGVCRTVKAGKTYSSLLNVGVQESRGEWVMFYMAGLPVRHGLLRKYHYFCEHDKQILYPVIDRKWLFDEASINGLFFNRKAMKDNGDFTEEEESFQSVKLLWAGHALDNGYQFRALVGVPR